MPVFHAEGRILDGRNRYRACLEAGIEPRFVQQTGEASLPELVLSRNLHRRHLNESQRALVAARLARLLTASGANLLTTEFQRSRDQAAAMIHVSTRLVIHATKVIKDGCDDLRAVAATGGSGHQNRDLPRTVHKHS